MSSPLLFCLFVLGISQPTQAAPLPFQQFLPHYLEKNSETQQAKRQLSAAKRSQVQATDLWQSRLQASENLAFENQNFDGGGRPDNTNRTNSLTGQFTQNLPTGTTLEVTGQKFLEIQNPLFNATDRRYSARLTQDLLKNAFGKSQRAQAKQGDTDFEVAYLQFRQAVVNSCEQAFTLYADAYIQQEIARILKAQLRDAEKALQISRKLYQDRLINKVDKLTSESDFIDTRLQVEQAEQMLLNAKLQIQAFLQDSLPPDFTLTDPSSFLTQQSPPREAATLREAILNKRLLSQDFAVEKARSDRWTDLQLGVEAGENFGRLNLGGPLVNYKEQFLRANLSVGFDLVNNTENAELKNAVYQKNSLEKEKQTLALTQKSKLQGLAAMNDLLQQQVKSSEKQVSLLQEKMRIAFGQMKRAKLDFQNYLLHRNAYLNQQRSYLNLKKDLWLNQFSIQKEYAQQTPQLCEVST